MERNLHQEARFEYSRAVKTAQREYRERTARGERGNLAALDELTGQTRKYSIPYAEHFDAKKVTLRVGDVRKLRGR